MPRFSHAIFPLNYYSFQFVHVSAEKWKSSSHEQEKSDKGQQEMEKELNQQEKLQVLENKLIKDIDSAWESFLQGSVKFYTLPTDAV